MRSTRSNSSFQSAGDSILLESVKYGPVVTFLLMAVISFGIAYLIYGYLLAGWAETNDQHRQAVIKKELDNKATENMLAGEPQFRAEFKKIVDLYQEAKPLLPEETEIADVLGQVETAAKR